MVQKWCKNVIINNSLNHFAFHVVPSAPLNISVQPLPGSVNELIAKWAPPIPKNGIINAYTVYCNMSANHTANQTSVIMSTVSNGTSQAVRFNTGSNPFTQYSCYVTANTSVGEGMPSLIVSGHISESGE